MFCSRCGYDNNESNVYCFNCGNLLISGRNEKNECGTTLFEEMKLRRERQERMAFTQRQPQTEEECEVGRTELIEKSRR
jgi:uncharacterized membrane protein YvbJ